MLGGIHTNDNRQNPTAEMDELLGLKNEVIDHGVFELDGGSCDQRFREGLGARESPRGEGVFVQQVRGRR